jgi:predicted RecA/RadA family phage recombinase
MTKRYVQPGNVIDYVAGSALASGRMVVIGGKVGVLGADAANGETVAAHVEGVFDYKKKAGDTFAQGALAYYDATNDYLTSTSSGNTLAGYAWLAAGAAATAMQIKINA